MIVKVGNNNVHGSTIFSLISIDNPPDRELDTEEVGNVGPPPLIKINNQTLVHSFQMHYHL
jgi:hypothetical protein